MRSGKIAELRLKKVLLSDRLNAPDELRQAIKGDMYEVLEAYSDVAPDSVRLTVEDDGRGGYQVTFTARAIRIKGLKPMPDRDVKEDQGGYR